MATLNTVNLDDLAGGSRAISWQGQTYRVRSLTVHIANLLDAASTAPPEHKMRGYLTAVGAMVPDLPPETLEDLTVAQVMAIIQLADPDYQGVPDDATAAEPEAAA